MTSSIDIRDDGPMIMATVLVLGCAPERALAAFTDPAVLASWWGGKLATDLEPGGPYTVTFAAINATLQGQVVTYQPGRSLEFAWAWAGDDSAPSAVKVTVVDGSEAGSTLLTVSHGPHDEDEPGKRSHQEHWEGWEFFLPRLATALLAES
jgi:uncharacterized protein YndB with AHSA1/START domain